MSKVRIIVRSHTIKDCAKVVSRKVNEGWEPLTKIKLDDSQISWGDVSYVCVMERKDDTPRKEKRFNRGTVGGLS